eukprot:3482604-Prymnesium_polylepis.1
MRKVLVTSLVIRVVMVVCAASSSEGVCPSHGPVLDAGRKGTETKGVPCYQTAASSSCRCGAVLGDGPPRRDLVRDSSRETWRR